MIFFAFFFMVVGVVWIALGLITHNGADKLTRIIVGAAWISVGAWGSIKYGRWLRRHRI
jgi:hypothetical protein